MIINKKTVLVVSLLCGWTLGSWAQAPVPADASWYLGVGGGTSFGQCTFRSISEHQTLWGAQGSIFAGYRFNHIFSVESGLQYGAQRQSALDCCPYWLSEDGVRYMGPAIDRTGWYYHDLDTRTLWGKLTLQVNANLLGLFVSPQCRWSLNVSPQVSAVTTKTTLVTPDKDIAHDRQWHLGLGGQVSVAYQITARLGASLYGGITCLGGERFDNLPDHCHKSNLIWDAGIRLGFLLGKAKSKTSVTPVAAPAVPAPEDVAAREREQAEKAAREAAERARLAAEKAAEKAAKEAAEREAAERAAAEAAMNAALQTPIPTVFFANNSSAIDPRHEASLAEALEILNKYSSFQLEIHAYCSRSGKKAYNEALSKKRMEAVQNWFVEHGIAKERLGKAFYHGIDYNAPSAAQARRAELWFVK